MTRRRDQSRRLLCLGLTSAALWALLHLIPASNPPPSFADARHEYDSHEQRRRRRREPQPRSGQHHQPMLGSPAPLSGLRRRITNAPEAAVAAGIGTLAVAAFRFGGPPLLRVLLPGRFRRFRTNNKNMAGGSQGSESFAQMLNLTKSQLAAAVHSGKMFNQTLLELEETLPLAEEGLERVVKEITSWTSLTAFKPGEAPIAKLQCAVDYFLFLVEMSSRRFAATRTSVEQLRTTSQKLNLTDLFRDCETTFKKVEGAQRMVNSAVEEVRGASIVEQVGGFLMGVLQQMEGVNRMLTAGQRGISMPEERLQQHVMTLESQIISHIKTALNYAKRMRALGKAIRIHTDLKDKWTEDVAALHPPVEPRQYALAELGDAADFVESTKKKSLKSLKQRHWFTAGLGLVERVNYYEGQMYMQLMAACRSVEELGKALAFLEKTSLNFDETIGENFQKLTELIGGVTRSIGQAASRNHRRCLISMEILMAQTPEQDFDKLGERLSWFQESAGQRLVTCDEDAGNCLDAARQVLSLWPAAQTELADLEKQFPSQPKGPARASGPTDVSVQGENS